MYYLFTAVGLHTEVYTEFRPAPTQTKIISKQTYL